MTLGEQKVHQHPWTLTSAWGSDWGLREGDPWSTEAALLLSPPQLLQSHTQLWKVRQGYSVPLLPAPEPASGADAIFLNERTLPAHSIGDIA